MPTPLEVFDDRVQLIADWVFELVNAKKIPIE